MCKSYYDLIERIKKQDNRFIVSKKNMLDYIEAAYDFGFEEGEDAGYVRAFQEFEEDED